MEDCVFCKIVRGKLPSRKIYEDKDIIAFFPKEPEAKGHLLIIPKKHYEDIFEISQEELKKLIIVVKKLSHTLKNKLGAKGVNILHASGKVAQQTVPHFHIHLIPRFEGDGIDCWMKQNNLGPYDLDELQKKIKE